jgi:chemotaxis signal transduction protein
MAEATAWLISFFGDVLAAVGEREMIHLVETPRLEEVPQTPLHCRQVLLWEGELLPVLDLTAWLTEQPMPCERVSVGIVGWQERHGAIPQYGALMFSGVPQKIRVSDDHVCNLPEHPAAWKAIAASCMRYADRPVPILDLPRIFSGAILVDTTIEHHNKS